MFRKTRFLLPLLVLFCVVFAASAQADTKVNVQYDVVFEPNMVADMITLVNEFRTGGEAWYYDEYGEQVYCDDLDELIYDDDLEKVAMQRAAECALNYDHTRPDGTSWSTAYPTALHQAENIAYGYLTSKMVFQAWREDDEDYDGQGHRRNMLKASFTHMGAGCVKAGGVFYWCQAFSSKLYDGTSIVLTTPVTVSASMDLLESNGISDAEASVESISVKQGKSESLPTITAKLTNCNDYSLSATLLNPAWKSSNSNASVKNGKVTGVTGGKARLKWSAGDCSLSVPVTIICKVHTQETDSGYPATCTEPGLSDGSHCSQCGTIIVPQEELDPLGHDWGEVEYTWAADYSFGTARRVCKNDESHVETETEDSAAEIILAPGCLEMGVTAYTVTFDNKAFEAMETTVENIPATGHNWDETKYEWAEDYSSVTASRVCLNDDTHTEEETAATTSEITLQPTCTVKGQTTYSATFDNTGFADAIKVVSNIDALGHDWGEVEYTWATDYSFGTARRVCKNDESHVETETEDSVAEIILAPDCLSMGVTAYTVTFDNKAFEAMETTVEDIPATGHNWDETKYEWAEDYSSVTASHVCLNDNTHTEEETAVTTSEITLQPTCTVKGQTTYSATFENTGFADASKVVSNIDALGHDWAEPTYTWSDNNSFVVARHVCTRDNKHSESETVQPSKLVIQAPTCEAAGSAVLTATFENPAFEKQEKTVEVPALGHAWSTPAYTWADDNSYVIASRTCGNDPDHREEETAATTRQDIAPTYVADGKIIYTAVFENTAFKKQTRELPGDPKLPPPTGEFVMPDTTEYLLNADLTATFVRPKAAATVKIPATISPVAGLTYKVTAIANEAFLNNRKVKTVKIGKYVRTIGARAFEKCTKLKTVTGGTGLVTIGNNAFKNCKALLSFTFGKKVSRIGQRAFYGCKALKTLIFRTTKLKKSRIGKNSFRNIYAKAEVFLPKAVMKKYKAWLTGKPKMPKTVYFKQQ